MQDLAGKVAFVTGGASGIGLAMVKSFLAADMKVVIADIEKAALNEVLLGLALGESQVTGIALDVSDRDAMEAAATRVENAFGKIHILCNNAGVAVGGSIEDMNYQDWDWVMNVNLQGTINGIQTFLPRILKHGEGGHIVNTASVAGQLAVAGMSFYTATKFAVVGLSEVMRLDLADKGVGVSVLCPGVVNTLGYNAGRNRPAALQREKRTDLNIFVDESLPDKERMQQMAELMESGMDPDAVARMVLQGIINNDLYIFTHPEQRNDIERRMQGILDGFDRCSAY